MERDSHYYLKYALALHACCYKPEQAHLIASGDWGQDTNPTTVAGPFSDNNLRWHALGSIEAKRRRLGELEQRVRQERDATRRLLKLGQLLHYVEDMHPHAGFCEGIGHARPTISGNDPDSLAADRNKTEGMVRSSISYLLLFCEPRMRRRARRRRTRELFDEIRRNGLLDDLIRQSDPAWKVPAGIMSQEGERIIQRNRRRIEEFLREVVPAKAAEIPGFAETGIPEHLEVEFDELGELIQIHPAEEEDRSEESSRRGNVRLESIEGRPNSDGTVEVSYVLHNHGAEASLAGVLSLEVMDASGQGILARSCERIPSIGQQSSLRSSIKVAVPSGLRALISVRAEVSDRNAHDNHGYLLVPTATEPAAPRSDPGGGLSPGSAAWSRFESHNAGRLRHLLEEGGVAARYVGEILGAIARGADAAHLPEEVTAAVNSGIDQIGRRVGEQIGQILADDVERMFVRAEGRSPYFSRTPDWDVVRDDDGECYIVVTVYAYSTEAQASEILKRVRVSLGNFARNRRFSAAASATEEEPSWHHESSAGNGGRRRTLEATEVYVPVPESVCDLVEDGRFNPRQLCVTVWEEIDPSIGSKKVTPISRCWRVSSRAIREALQEAECCE